MLSIIYLICCYSVFKICLWFSIELNNPCIIFCAFQQHVFLSLWRWRDGQAALYQMIKMWMCAVTLIPWVVFTMMSRRAVGKKGPAYTPESWQQTESYDLQFESFQRSARGISLTRGIQSFGFLTQCQNQIWQTTLNWKVKNEYTVLTWLSTYMTQCFLVIYATCTKDKMRIVVEKIKRLFKGWIY